MTFLRRLIIEGFKSFADRTVIDFSDGMTAVIGPNGSGKSNVTDAIRWVLGETSAKNLRGGKMEDVIFKGSDFRPAMQRASVTMILNNENGLFSSSLGEEISVSRAYSQKKGSEFFINGEPCRQRDVHDLFLDSGIGSDSYSLVGQNQVQDLVSEDKQKRRNIFEEAAGIVKIRKQKEETETKLKQVEQSLLRFSDILSEMNKQIEPLQRQAKKALRHREVTENLREIEIDFYTREQSQMQQRVQEWQQKWEHSQSKLLLVTDELATAETHVQKLKEELDEQQNNLFTLQSNIATQTETVEKKISQVRLGEQDLSHTRETHQRIHEQLHAFEEKYSISSEDVLGKKEELEQLGHTIASMQSRIEELIRDISKVESNASMMRIRHEKKKEDTIALYNELSVQQERKDTQEQERQKLWKQIEQLQEKQRELQERQTIFQKQGEDLAEKSNQLSEEISRYETEEKNLHLSLSSAQAKRDELLQNQRQIETKLVKLSSEREQIERMVNNHEGYFEGVKSVLQESSRLSGILGPVASVLDVPEEHERAMEELLQSTAQHVITRTEEDAKHAVRWLETQQKGRATFLPLSLAKPQQFSPAEQECIQQYPSLRYAVDTVHFDEMYRPVMSMLLGRCLVAEDLESAISFVRSHRFHVKIATKNGQLVQSSSITGGRQKGKGQLLSQRRRLQELLQSEEKETVQHEKTIKELNEMNVFISQEQEKTSSFQHILLELRQQAQEHHTRQRLWEQEQKQMEDSSRLWAWEEQEKRTEWETLSQTIDELRDMIQTRTRKHQVSQRELEEFTESVQQENNKLSVLQEQKTEMMLELSRLQEEQKQTERALSHFGNQSDEVKTQLQYLTQEEQRLQQKDLLLETELKHLKEATEKEQQTLLEMQNEVTVNKDVLSSLSTQWKESDVNVQKLRQKREAQEKEVYACEMNREKEQTRLEQARRILQETYGLGEVTNTLPPFTSEEYQAQKQQISSLKQQLQAIGTVNLLAPEEYEELSTRYEEQRIQYEDMKRAETDLRQLLRQVVQEMTQRFVISFETISSTFSTMFRQFFGGGEGILKLEDPKNPLDSSIKIIAKPPGKKTEELSLLSGGERSLVAVVIIFSILKSKPSPFVILDELDAPLDEANIVRFTKHLRTFIDRSQFIVITHRKNTMMVVDNIYGVTQQEEGVSMVLPLVLEDLDKRFAI